MNEAADDHHDAGHGDRVVPGDAHADAGGAGRVATAVAESPFAHARPPRWPRLHPDLIMAVFLGGCLGGYLRYAVTRAWPAASGHFPWSTLAVNVAGAFVLTVVVIIAAEVAPSRYLRPLLGTGFCGGLTTFSAVVVATDRLVAHQHAVTGVTYLLSTLAAGLVAGWSGLVTGRAVAATHRRTHQRRSSS